MIKWAMGLLLVLPWNGFAAYQSVSQTLVNSKPLSVSQVAIEPKLPRLQHVETTRSPFSLPGKARLRSSQASSPCLSQMSATASQSVKPDESLAFSSDVGHIALQGIVQEHGARIAIIQLPSHQLRWVTTDDQLLQGRVTIDAVSAISVKLIARLKDGRCYRSSLALSGELGDEQ
ncbi:MAG: hypothetical protein ACTMIA_01965 [Vibrio sp.]